MALFAHHLARSKVGHKQHLLAHELLRVVIVGSNAAEDGASVGSAVVDVELQQLLRFLHFFATGNKAYAYVKLLEGVEVDILFDGFGFVVGVFVGLLGVFQLLS